MRCARCGFENDDTWLACPRCAAKGGGRTRPASRDEACQPQILFRADAVLARTGPISDDLTVSEQRIAGLIDGVRPVARILKRSGSTAAQLRVALASLNERGLIRLVGIVEASGAVVEASITEDETSTRGRPDIISPRVLAEIDAMIAEETAISENTGLAGVDDPTDILPLPPSEEDEEA